MKKKILSIGVLAVCLLMVLAGCSRQESSSSTTSSSAPAQSSTAAAAPARADYPTRPITIIVPFSPGGGSDVLTRSMMEYLELPNDQNWVVVNVEGASGYIGAQQAFNSRNDGYTYLAHNPMDVVSYTLGGVTEQPLYSDLELVCGIADDFNFIVTNKQSGWTTLEEMVEYVKAHPGEVRVGNTGSMNSNMAECLRVFRALGIEDLVTIVPYNSGADNRVACMGNHVQLSCNTGADIQSSVMSGDLVPLVVISDRRSKSLTDVPCTAELGIDVVTTKPRGLYAPAGVNPEYLQVIKDAVKAVCDMPEYQERVLALGLEVNYVDGEELQQKIDNWVVELTPVFEEMKANN